MIGALGAGYDKMLVAIEYALLTFRRAKSSHRYSYRFTGMAIWAVWAADLLAAASKPYLNKLTVTPRKLVI